jgi:hypothetical protein
MPWFTLLVADLSPRKAGLAPGSVHVTFVVKNMALGQVFPRYLLFSLVNIIPQRLRTHMSSGGGGDVQQVRLWPKFRDTVSPLST